MVLRHAWAISDWALSPSRQMFPVGMLIMSTGLIKNTESGSRKARRG